MTRQTKAMRVLREYRRKTGDSVADIAKKTGLSRQFIYWLQDGTYDAGAKSARKIRDGLGISLDKLL